MTMQEFEAQLYTLPVHPEDIVVLHLEYAMESAERVRFSKVMHAMLKARGQDNSIVILQPGQMLRTIRGVEIVPSHGQEGRPESRPPQS